MALKTTTKKPAQIIAEASFVLWQSKDFRALVRFNILGQVEQDRIFNELELTGLGLSCLYSEQTGKEHFKKEVTEQFLQIMSESGLEGKFLDIWKKLIKIRFEEYENDYKKVLYTSEDKKEFDNEENLRLAWTRIETLAVAGWTHIRRGENKEEDPLWDIMRKWLAVLDAQLLQNLNLKELLIPSQKLN